MGCRWPLPHSRSDVHVEFGACTGAVRSLPFEASTLLVRSFTVAVLPAETVSIQVSSYQQLETGGLDPPLG